jgi:RNA polymerase primary sigma factor
MAKAMHISLQRAEGLERLIAGIRSLDQEAGGETLEHLTTQDVMDAPPSVEEVVELRLVREQLNRLLRKLSLGEEQILRIRYGLHDGIARTLAQTGAQFGISRERVRQIEHRALTKLRRFILEQETEAAAKPTVH